VLRTTTPVTIAAITTTSATTSATTCCARRGPKSAYQLMHRAWRTDAVSTRTLRALPTPQGWPLCAVVQELRGCCAGMRDRTPVNTGVRSDRAPRTPAQQEGQDAARTRSRKRSWKRCSRVISGWNDVPIRLPCSTATTRPSSSAASTVASGPTDSTIGARMNTACTAGSPSCGMSRSVSNESFWLPKALRRTATSSPPKLCCPSMASSTESASRISPAHVPYTGMPPAMRLRRGSATPKERLSLSITLDSPPGITSPETVSSSSGRRTVTASAPSSRSTARCSRTSPCSARTPTLGALPATLGETVRRRKVGHVDADHGLAQPARGIRDHARVVEERRGLHDRGGALRGLPRLEDAGSDEYAVRPELHHERRIRGRRD